MKYHYGLSPQEANTIYAMEFSPLENINVVAKASRMKGTSLAASLRRMKDKKIISQQAIFNPFAVGAIPVAVYGQLLERTPTEKQALLEKMLSARNATYVIETLGQYNFFFSILVSSLDRIPCVMRDLFESQGDIFTGKLIAPRLEILSFPKKFLAKDNKNIQFKEIKCSSEQSKVYATDELDRKILEIVCNHGFESFRQLANALSEPASTVERRIRRLSEKKIIAGFRYFVNPNVIQTQQVRLLVSKKGFCGNTNDKVLKFSKEHPKIVRLTRAIGAWDYEISLEVAHLNEVSSVVNDLHQLCSVRLSHVEVVTELKTILKRPYAMPKELLV